MPRLQGALEADPMKRVPGVIRCRSARCSSRGWQAVLWAPRKGGPARQAWTRYFADRKHGGRERAYQKALRALRAARRGER